MATTPAPAVVAAPATKAPARKTTTKTAPAKNKATKAPVQTETYTDLPEAELQAIQSAAKNAPTEVHKNMVAWLAEAGVEADLETVKLAFALRHVFQKSETNQKHLTDRKSAAEAKLQERAAKAAERAKKAMEKAAKLAEEAKKSAK